MTQSICKKDRKQVITIIDGDVLPLVTIGEYEGIEDLLIRCCYKVMWTTWLVDYGRVRIEKN